MIDPLFALSESLNTDLFRLRSISQNLANVNTPGYKREVAVISSFDALLAGAGQEGRATISSNDSVRKLVTDFSTGALKLTGNINDVAIGSDAFFVVEREGDNLYTRKGQFALGHNGILTLRTGESVMGRSGIIHLKNAPYQISSSGIIEQDGIAIDQLRLARILQTESTRYHGGGLFSVPDTDVETVENYWDAGIAQGYLEASNVDTTDEMVSMIEIVRHFESAQKVLQGYDDMLDVSINVLADFSG